MSLSNIFAQGEETVRPSTITYLKAPLASSVSTTIYFMLQDRGAGSKDIGAGDKLCQFSKFKLYLYLVRLLIAQEDFNLFDWPKRNVCNLE